MLVTIFHAPPLLRSILSTRRHFVCGSTGYAYQEKQWSHFGGFFYTSVQHSEPEERRDEKEITRDYGGGISVAI